MVEEEQIRMQEYHVIIIGGGPAGLTAGLYAARAHLSTVLLEAMIPSGQAYMAERIENYPGFPDGIAGRELVERFVRQATTFGLEIRQFNKVESVARAGKTIIIEAGGDQFSTTDPYHRQRCPGQYLGDTRRGYIHRQGDLVLCYL